MCGLIDDFVGRGVQEALVQSVLELPYCAFNGNRDVWVDVGDKRHGILGQTPHTRPSARRGFVPWQGGTRLCTVLGHGTHCPPSFAAGPAPACSSSLPPYLPPSHSLVATLLKAFESVGGDLPQHQVVDLRRRRTACHVSWVDMTAAAHEIA